MKIQIQAEMMRDSKVVLNFCFVVCLMQKERKVLYEKCDPAGNIQRPSDVVNPSRKESVPGGWDLSMRCQGKSEGCAVRKKNCFVTKTLPNFAGYILFNNNNQKKKPSVISEAVGEPVSSS